MPSPSPYELTLLPGARELLAAHAREAPQRDELCGAFCGALALHAAGFGSHPPRGGEPLDQDAVAVAAGSVLAATPDPSHLPPGAVGRRDYRVELPRVADSALSGTTAAGLLAAVEELSGEALQAVPFAGPWSAAALGGLFDAAAAAERPVTLIANLATGHLWGGGVSAARLFAYLDDGDPAAGPEPDWSVGHFVCVFGRLRGPRGSVYGVADTYPALGAGGVHLQPAERLAAALARPEAPAGGIVVVARPEDAAHIRAGARAGGLLEGVWDNGSLAAPTEDSTAGPDPVGRDPVEPSRPTDPARARAGGRP